MAHVGRLLEGMREPDETRLAPRGSDKGDADRQAADEAGRNGDAGIAGDGGGRAVAAGVVVAVQQVGDPGRSAGGRDEGVESVLLHDGVDPFGARQSATRRQGSSIRLVCERAFLWARRIISWPKYGISRSRFRSLNAMRSASVCTATSGPRRRDRR